MCAPEHISLVIYVPQAIITRARRFPLRKCRGDKQWYNYAFHLQIVWHVRHRQQLKGRNGGVSVIFLRPCKHLRDGRGPVQSANPSTHITKQVKIEEQYIAHTECHLMSESQAVRKWWCASNAGSGFMILIWDSETKCCCTYCDQKLYQKQLYL